MGVENGIAETYVRTATIASGASLSDEIDLGNWRHIGLVMPGTWTTASITFAVSNKSGGTFVPLYDDGGIEVTVSASQGTAVGLSLAALALAPWRYVKIRSGTSASAVNQAGDRTIEVVLKA